MTDTPPGAIGQALRHRRLQKNITVEDVAAATRVQAKFLKALEDENWADLPARVYLEGFLAKYAEYLGLDGPDLVRQWRSGAGDGEKPSFTHPKPVPEALEGKSLFHVRLPILFLALAFLLLAGFYFYRSQQDRARNVPLSLSAVNETEPLRPLASAVWTEPAAPFPADHTASVRALEMVWLRVWSDGAVRFEGTLAKGETRRWPFQSSLRIRAGSLSHLSAEIDGVPQAVSFNSNPGEIRWPSGDGDRPAARVNPAGPSVVAVSTGTLPVVRFDPTQSIRDSGGPEARDPR